MVLKTISIEVDAVAAQAYTQASPVDRQKIDLLLALRLKELTAGSRKSLTAIMDEISEKAKAQGLRQEQMESLLHDD